MTLFLFPKQAGHSLYIKWFLKSETSFFLSKKSIKKGLKTVKSIEEISKRIHNILNFILNVGGLEVGVRQRFNASVGTSSI